MARSYLGLAGQYRNPPMLDHASSTRASDKYPTLRGKQILVVEDDALIAVDYHFQLREVGAQPKAYEPTSKAALDYLATHDIDAAIVDYRLRDGTCEQVLKFCAAATYPSSSSRAASSKCAATT